MKQLIASGIILMMSMFAIDSHAITASSKLVTTFIDESATVNISDYSDPLTVSIKNSVVASASLSGGTVTLNGLTAGNTKLTVQDANPKKKLTIVVKVLTPMTVAPSSVTLMNGSSANVKVVKASGNVSIVNSNSGIVRASIKGKFIKVTALSPGSAVLTVKDKYRVLSVPVVVTAAVSSTGYTLLAWNDLGMHCMDSDYSVFSILPPFNNLHAQLVDNASGKLVNANVSLTYEAMADPAGSTNSYSILGPSKKTNFWDYAQAFFGSNPGDDVGLTGNRAPSATPRLLTLNGNEFVASGIPVTPYDDAGNKNTYPLVKVVAKDNLGNQIATARVVLPVSDEMNCSSCHTTNTNNDAVSIAAKPAGGWVTDETNPERQYRLNILRLHDEKAWASADFQNALVAANYNGGLEVSARAGRPVLCAACHASNALGTSSIAGTKPLTESMHAKHASVTDPTSGQTLDSSTNRSSCYQCHPGSTTKCLRGAMGSATLADGSMAMQCQSCHGNMSHVGASGRVGWLQQPNCQACHHDGKRELEAVNSSGQLKTWTDNRFATTANSPAAGYSLFRTSEGHGGLKCEACHGATHAEYTSSHVNDNLLSMDTQGYLGTVAECSSCHASNISNKNPLNGGPHGMHVVGQAWVSGHQKYAEHNTASCGYCHGSTFRGTSLSKLKVARTFSVDDGRSKSFPEGTMMGCYNCHNGPKGDD